MGTLPPTILIVALGAAILYAITKLLAVGRRPSDFPPGPPTLPIIGNLHLVCWHLVGPFLQLTHTDARQKTPPAIPEMGSRIRVRC